MSGVRSVTKYSPDMSHWDEDNEPEDDPDPRPRVETHMHTTDTIVIDRFVDEEYVDRYRWRFAIEDRTVVGWTRSDIEPNGTVDYCADLTLETMPMDVRVRLERELGVDDLADHANLPEHLHSDPETREPTREVECVHCGTTVSADGILDHHMRKHPNQRYDPVWYMEVDSDAE